MSSSTLRALVVSFSLLLITAPRLAWAQFDPAAQFSPINNPNGVWRYGFENFPLPNPFNLFGAHLTISGVDAREPATFGQVGVFHNPTAAVVNYVQSGDNAVYQPGQIGMHPGPNDQYAVIQFSAPAPGLYKIHGTFEGLDLAGTNTLVSLLFNNIPVASGNVIGFGPASDVPLSFGPVVLNVGDTLAFATGGNPTGGSTGLLHDAVVDAVPEPASLAILSIAAICFTRRPRRVYLPYAPPTASHNPSKHPSRSRA